MRTHQIASRLGTGGYVSAQATVADLDHDGQPEIIVGSDALYAWRVDGRLLPGFPVRGGNFFASRPAVGDIDGDGRLEVVVGCDDDSLYAFTASGRPLPGWPRPTGGDVYSSPALADLDGDGMLEVVAGSDDGRVYIWRHDGSPFGGSWPQRTAGFVSSSPRLADLDGDGQLEIIIGSWDRNVYAWKTDGSALGGWPQPAGHFVWSTPAVADLDGDGQREVIVASDKLYVWRSDGRPYAGPGSLADWPQALGSYCAGSPLVTDIDGDGQLEVIVGCDKLYAWRADGSPLHGFPVDLGCFLWSSPAAGDVDGDGRAEIVIAGWDGCVYVVRADGASTVLGRSGGPFFATPTLHDLDGDGRMEVIVGSWDGRVHIVRWDAAIQRKSIQPRRSTVCDGMTGARREHLVVKESVAPFMTIPGAPSSRAILHYRAHFENTWHPVPLLVHHGQLTGLIQPFLAGTRVEYWAETADGQGAWRRAPAEGVWSYTVQADWRARIGRRLRRWLRR